MPGWVLRGPEQRLPGRGRVNSPPGITALNPSPWQIKPIRGTSNPQSPTLFKSARRQLGSFGQGTDKARLSRGKFPRLWSGCCRQLPGGLFQIQELCPSRGTVGSPSQGTCGSALSPPGAAWSESGKRDFSHIAAPKVTSQIPDPLGKRPPVPPGLPRVTPSQETAQHCSNHMLQGASSASVVPWEVAAGSQCHLHASRSQQGRRCLAMLAAGPRDTCSRCF